MIRTLFILGLGAMLLIGSGCRRGAAPDFDRINMILLQDLLAAIHDGDHEAAIKKLERLHDLNPDIADIDDLIRAEQDSEIIATADKHLADDDLQGALDSVRKARLQYGASPVLTDAQAGLDGLAAVAAFRRDMVDVEPRRFAAAVAGLPKAEVFKDAAPRYQEWHKQQEMLASDMLGTLKTELIHRFAGELAAVLVSRDQHRLQELLDKLAILSRDQPVVSAAAIAPRAVGLPHLWRDLSDQTDREIVAWYYYYYGPAADRVDITEVAAAWEPVTPCGIYLKADIALSRKDAAAGAALVRQLLERVPDADLSRLFPAMDRLLSPADGRPPSVPGVLDELSHLAAPAR